MMLSATKALMGTAEEAFSRSLIMARPRSRGGILVRPPPKSRSQPQFSSTRQCPKVSAAPYSHIVQLGDPVLRTTCREIDTSRLRSPEIQRMISMFRHALSNNDALGISAPQLGLSLRAFAVCCTKEQVQCWPPEVVQGRQMEPLPFRVFINPVMKIPPSKDSKGWALLEDREGCCSVHGFSAVVARHPEVTVSAVDPDGEPITWLAKGWSARIVQHEMDHLDGVCFVDKMVSPKTLEFNYWKTVNDREGSFSLGYGGFTGWRKYFKIAPFFKKPSHS